MRFEEPEKLHRLDNFEDVRPGGYIPSEHLKDMDADGVDVSIVYPSCGLRLFGTVPDSDLLTAISGRTMTTLASFAARTPSVSVASQW